MYNTLVDQMAETTDYTITVYGNSGVQIDDTLRLAFPMYLEEGDFDKDALDSIFYIGTRNGVGMLVNSYSRIPALDGVARIVVMEVGNDG